MCGCVRSFCVSIKRRFKGHFIYNVRFAGVSIFERLRAIFCKNTLDLWGCNLFMCAPSIDYCFNIHMSHLMLLLVCYWCWCRWYCYCSVALGVSFSFFIHFPSHSHVQKFIKCDSIATVFYCKLAMD